MGELIQMADKFEANDEVYTLMRNLIANYHPDLASVDKEIAIVMRAKAGKSGGQVVLGKTSKAPWQLGVLGSREYKFIIELAGDEWNNLTDKQREALMDHHLCACGVDIDDVSGEIKCQVLPPDFVGYRGELERHGIWRTAPTQDGETPDDTDVIKMFS